MSNGLSIGVLIAVVALLGIPHGAVDHLVAAEISVHQERSALRSLRFQLVYLAAVVASGVAWLVSAPLALAVFLLLSVHHFGQSDLAHLGCQRGKQLALQWSRGVFVLGLPLVAHVGVVSPYIARLGGGSPARWSWLAGHTGAWCVALIAQHVAVGTLVAPTIRNSALVYRQVVSVTTLTVVLLVANPLLGFAVYFGFWHSLGHLRIVRRVLGNRSAPLGIRQFARLAAPRTGLALVGLIIVMVSTRLAGRADLAVPAVFVVLSMLTFPHLLVVERLWRHLLPGQQQSADDERHGLIAAEAGYRHDSHIASRGAGCP